MNGSFFCRQLSSQLPPLSKALLSPEVHHKDEKIQCHLGLNGNQCTGSI